MFSFAEGASSFSVWLVWIGIFAALFILNEITRRSTIAGFLAFVVAPTVLTVLWFTVFKDTTYTDWFHLAKVYSATAGKTSQPVKNGDYLKRSGFFVSHH